MTMPGVEIFPSPYARGAPELIRLGYHPLPIMPGEKRPGVYTGGKWHGLKSWEQYRDRLPSTIDTRLWSNNSPDANIGVVLGSSIRVDGHPALLYVIAIDIDVDGDDYDALVRQIPRSPMVKRGAKGETRFFLAPKSLKSRPYSVGRRRIVDLLTGFDTRQTVVPPSLHASTGQPYQWTAGPVHARELPVFDAGDLERMEEALSALGWCTSSEAERAVSTDLSAKAGLIQPKHPPVFEPDYWSEVKDAALANLSAWVPALGLYDCRRARGGYEAVATWRPSSSGNPIEKRKRNLSIQSIGITDFGVQQGYSAIDLVMAARVCGQEEATSWLRERLGMSTEPVIFNMTAPTCKPVLQVASLEKIIRLPDELPNALTKVPGLLGELVEWIVGTASRPQRGLSLGAALCILGTAAGRRYAGPTRTATHLYVLGLTLSSAGKDHPLKCIDRALRASGMASHIGPSKFMSLSAVVNRLIRDPLVVCPMDEFAAVLKSMNSRNASTHEAAISGILRSAWGCSFSTLMTPEWAGREAEAVHTPAMSVFGISTHKEFYASLGGGDVDNGFLNRFLMISTMRKPAEIELTTTIHDPLPDNVTAGLMSVYGGGISRSTHSNGQADAPAIVATWDSDGARQVYGDLSAWCDDRSEEEATFFGRTAEMAQRLATIRGIGLNEFEPTITVSDMEWGRDVALWSARRMMTETADYMAETQNQADTQRVMRIIRDATELRGVIGHSDLLKAMGHRLKAKDLKDIISDLLDSGRIQAQQTAAASGAPGRSYRAVG